MYWKYAETSSPRKINPDDQISIPISSHLIHIMARKKSATKKAAEAAARAAFDKAEQGGLPVAVAEKSARDDDNSASSSSSSSEDEDEDDYGELITEDVEKGIQMVISTIRSDPKKLLDPNTKFFENPEQAVSSTAKAQKPMYLKDYHRMNLLSGDYQNDDDDDDAENANNEHGTIDGEKPFVVTEREERNQILADIKDAFKEGDGDESEGDDGDEFLKKKANPTRDQLAKADPSFRQELLPDPEKNQEAFLSAFLDSQAWIPKKGDKVINLDKIEKEDEAEFDDAVEDYERAYNFRFEEEQLADIVSYARNQASLRRANTNLRKRKRDEATGTRETERKEKEELIKRKQNEKMNKVMDRLAKIKEAVGSEVSDETISRVFGNSLLEDDFDDADWDGKMAEIFNEAFYGAEDEKPTWDDDMSAEEESHNPEEEEEEANGDDAQQLHDKKKSKKDTLKDKKSKKKSKESIRQKAAAIVEANKLSIADEVEEERGRSKSADDVKFKYRDVSPESFGLNTRDILLANDQQLNAYIGIKKFAPYRPKELQMKDKRKFAKKKQLQQWRKEVFNDKNGAPLPEGAEENEVWIPAEDEAATEPKRKHRKHHKRA